MLKSFWSCSHMNCCLHDTHQFTYFIYYSSQDKLEISRIKKIQQVLEKLTNQQN